MNTEVVSSAVVTVVVASVVASTVVNTAVDTAEASVAIKEVSTLLYIGCGVDGRDVDGIVAMSLIC